MTDKVELSKAILAPNGNVKMVDWAGAINLLPLQYGLIGKMGVFGERFGTQKNFFVTKNNGENIPLLEDRNWETTRPSIGRPEYTGAQFPVGHYPTRDFLTPQDIDGVANYETLVPGVELDSITRLRTQLLARIRDAHVQLHEFARGYALSTGKVYAPNGTLKTSYGNEVDVYQEWGIVRGSGTIDLTVGTNPLNSVNEVFSNLQGRARIGDSLGGFVVLCGKTLFQKLITNEYITDVYATAQLEGRKQLLVDRLGNSVGMDARYRSFSYGGLLFVETPDVVGGRKVVADDKGIAFPMGMELGRMHFAPANRFTHINEVSQASYVFERLSADDDKLEFLAETNFAAILDRPDLVIDVTFTE